MIYKIENEKKRGNLYIHALYPGLAIGNSEDTGLGPIGRIDHSTIPGGVTIKMHPHSNDDILSYFRVGYAQHTDSEGFEAKIARNKLMLMKAGKIFYHEEAIPELLEGLQIFIRPKTKDAVPQVVFQDLEETDSVDAWRLLASPTTQTVLQFTSQVWIYDTILTKGRKIALPEFPKDTMTGLLYVFQGNCKINKGLKLSKGESIVFKEETILVNALETSELVLFLMDENSEYYDGGMYSGNQY